MNSARHPANTIGDSLRVLANALCLIWGHSTSLYWPKLANARGAISSSANAHVSIVENLQTTVVVRFGNENSSSW